MKHSIITLLISVLLASTVVGQSIHQLQREGDRHYEKSKYREAEQAYKQAKKKKDSNPEVAYNTGNAVYQQGNYADSEQFFEQAAKTAKGQALQADALHNLGNAYLKQQKYKEAVSAYENSLRNRPGDPDTKVNLQLAKKKWQQQQEQQKKNQQQQNKPSDQQSDDQEDQSQGKSNNQPNQDPSKAQNQPNQQKQPQDQPSDGRMTKGQAHRLLERAVAPEDQRNARKYREMEPGKHQVKPKKDW